MRTSDKERIWKQNKINLRWELVYKIMTHLECNLCICKNWAMILVSEHRNMQSQEGRWSVRWRKIITYKWHSVPEVKKKKKTHKIKTKDSWPEVQHFWDPKEDTVWYGKITFSTTASINTVVSFVYCLLIPLFHWRFYLYWQSKLWRNAKAKFNKCHFRMQINATKDAVFWWFDLK